LKQLKERIGKIFNQSSEKQNPEAVFIFNSERVDKNFYYLTGLSGGVFENCGVLCESSGKMYIFTSTLEEEAVRAAERDAEVVVYKKEKERDKNLEKVLSKYSTIGISYSSITHSFYLHLKEMIDKTALFDVGNRFRCARMIKTDDEIERIQKACAIVSEVADNIPYMLKEGITELDLSAEIDFKMKKEGAHGSAFKTIVSFSKNTSMPHYSGADVPLKGGDVVLVDFGAEYMSYNSDITRTYMTGTPDKELLHLYKTVLEAQQNALKEIREGEGVDIVDEAIRRFINSHESYNGRFIHSLGHSIGLDVHDDRYPSIEFNKRFAENMVLTVEPGIYLPGIYGIRIEDDIVVKKEGCKVLTSAMKEPLTYEI
jgi:Xaa-Pro dipeptidase